jgi:hypothetical protein
VAPTPVSLFRRRDSTESSSAARQPSCPAPRRNRTPAPSPQRRVDTTDLARSHDPYARCRSHHWFDQQRRSVTNSSCIRPIGLVTVRSSVTVGHVFVADARLEQGGPSPTTRRANGWGCCLLRLTAVAGISVSAGFIPEGLPSEWFRAGGVAERDVLLLDGPDLDSCYVGA